MLTISAFLLDSPTKRFITGMECSQCFSIPSQQADCSHLMCWSHEGPGYGGPNSKGKTYFKEKMQTTSSSSEILFSFELMKGAWYSCRQIMLIWHSKSSVRHVIKMQISLGWISCLGHSIIRIATCQALGFISISDWGRKGIRGFSWEKAYKDHQALGKCSRTEMDRCTQTSTHMNTHIPEPPESNRRRHHASVFPWKSGNSWTAGEETCDEKIKCGCRCHCEMWAVLVIM